MMKVALGLLVFLQSLASAYPPDPYFDRPGLDSSFYKNFQQRCAAKHFSCSKKLYDSISRMMTDLEAYVKQVDQLGGNISLGDKAAKSFRKSGLHFLELFNAEIGLLTSDGAELLIPIVAHMKEHIPESLRPLVANEFKTIREFIVNRASARASRRHYAIVWQVPAVYGGIVLLSAAITQTLVGGLDLRTCLIGLGIFTVPPF